MVGGGGVVGGWGWRGGGHAFVAVMGVLVLWVLLGPGGEGLESADAGENEAGTYRYFIRTSRISVPPSEA